MEALERAYPCRRLPFATTQEEVTMQNETEAQGTPARKPISLRLRPGLSGRVHGAAAAEGRSFNDMFNVLLERGLESERQVTVAFGSPAALAVARALIGAAEAAAVREGADQGLWLYEPVNFQLAVDAMNKMLEAIRPRPEAQEVLDEIAEARKRGGRRG